LLTHTPHLLTIKEKSICSPPHVIWKVNDVPHPGAYACKRKRGRKRG
jgi:hypothetical protein